MKRLVGSMAILVLVLALAQAAGADQRRARGQFYGYRGGASHRAVVPRYYYHGHPHYYYYVAPGYYYWPNYPAVVVSPYTQSYILPPAVVVNAPYFCLLHNQGFVSLAGLLDHLAGIHKVPLDSAANFCPDGANCVFPSP